ncbi:glycosyltransferase [Williamsia herbipolensis]|uniref:glycosyltransferase n=1 Tax=Williamsia herbipolensis TaxID=1603258 RepID=UPI001EF142E5|nr:glycosyltransferase family 2 protein [Williamsia herbipolensis]
MTVEQKSVVAVIVPAHNEEKYIAHTLRALDRQEFRVVGDGRVLDTFRVIVVDNASTDGTRDVVAAHIASNPRVPVELITESEKGTGCAVDTAARHAIATGAHYVARTDADCLPRTDWLSRVITPLLDGKRLVAGRLRARTDEGSTGYVFNAVGTFWRLGHLLQWWATRHEADANRRSFAVCGGNMAFDADIYLTSGGFPRVRIDEANEDDMLQRRVRAITDKRGLALAPKAVVYISLRRLKAVGVKEFAAWYGTEERDSTGKQVDIR